MASIRYRICCGQTDLGSRPKAELLWASTRELLNIFHAEESGCDIVTVPNEFLAKLDLVGKDLARIFAGNSAGCFIAMQRPRHIRSGRRASPRNKARERRRQHDPRPMIVSRRQALSDTQR